MAILLSSIFLAVPQQLQNNLSYHTEGDRLLIWPFFFFMCSVVQRVALEIIVH